VGVSRHTLGHRGVAWLVGRRGLEPRTSAVTGRERPLTGHELDELLALSARVWTVTPAGLAD
jgi:hypothetical protein